MTKSSNDLEELFRKAGQGDQQALGELFDLHRDRLRRMVHLRLDRRLHGRIDASDVIQETYLEAMKSFPNYEHKSESSFFMWLRCLTGRKLMDLHRYHLGALRDARREVTLYRGPMPSATSEALAANLLGHFTSPTEAAVRAERRLRLQEALNRMSLMDREVLALRHFEQLTNAETAVALGIQESAASKRHFQAMKRLKEILKTIGV